MTGQSPPITRSGSEKTPQARKPPIRTPENKPSNWWTSPRIFVLSASPSQGGGLAVRFSDGTEAQYHPGWLRAFARETQEAPFALPPRQLWTGDDLAAQPRFSAEAVDHDPQAFEAYCEALHALGFAILEGVTPRPGQVEQVAQRLGPLRESNFGRLFDVRTETEQTSNAYTTMALPVHADLCTREHMPGLQFLHCLENSTVGGATRLTDGFQLAETLRKEDPSAFKTSAPSLCFLPTGQRIRTTAGRRPS